MTPQHSDTVLQPGVYLIQLPPRNPDTESAGDPEEIGDTYDMVVVEYRAVRKKLAGGLINHTDLPSVPELFVIIGGVPYEEKWAREYMPDIKWARVLEADDEKFAGDFKHLYPSHPEPYINYAYRRSLYAKHRIVDGYSHQQAMDSDEYKRRNQYNVGVKRKRADAKKRYPRHHEYEEYTATPNDLHGDPDSADRE